MDEFTIYELESFF